MDTTADIPRHTLSASPRREDRAQEILAAAKRAFSANGFERTSIKDIAREAGIRSPSIVHYHFASKEELLLEMVRAELMEIVGKVQERFRSAPPRERSLLAALDMLWDSLDHDPALTGLLLEAASAARHNPAVREQMQRFIASVRELIVRLIEEGLGDKARRLPVNPQAIATLIITVIEGYAMEDAASGGAASRQTREAFRSLLALIKPSRS
ncbi:MAG: HTH-type transcriptional regulator BetI [Myxococcota bacterium]|nr:HTH-type transcriptional regulator BetI [Myxococcota bacterium]